MTRDKRRACNACTVTLIACRALARHRTHPCCRHCNHEPQEDQS